jgi:ATP-dependent Clp protease ATP-binding subunit ClpX
MPREPKLTSHPVHCSFCGKSHHEVDWMIASPADWDRHTFICDACVALCTEIITEQRVARATLAGANITPLQGN